jgi:hypothetical protein
MRSCAVLLPVLLVGCLSVMERHPGAMGALSSGGGPLAGAAVWQTGDVGPGACRASEPESHEFVSRSDSRGRFEVLSGRGWRLTGALPLPAEPTRRWTLCVRPQAGPVFASTLYSYGRGVPGVARYGCELGHASLVCSWDRTRPPASFRW